MTKRYFIYFWAAMLVGISVGCWFVVDYGIPTIETALDGNDILRKARSFRYALFWSLSVFVVNVALAMASCVSLLVLSEAIRVRGGWRFILNGMIVFMPIAVFALSMIWADGNSEGLFYKISSALNVNPVTRGRYVELGQGASFINAIGSSCCVWILSAMVALTYRRQKITDDVEAEIKILSSRIKRMRILLPLCALGLVFGVLATAARLSLLVDPELYGVASNELEGAKSIVQSATLAYGCIFSIMLLVGHTPVAIILRSWGNDLADLSHPEADSTKRKKWWEDNGISMPHTLQIKDIFIILAPFLTSLLGEPISTLLPKFVSM